MDRTTIAGQAVEVWLVRTGVDGADRWAASLARRPRRIGAGGATPPHSIWTGPATEQGKAQAVAMLAREIEAGPPHA